MIFLDTPGAALGAPKSGLNRVRQRLGEALGTDALAAVWRDGDWHAPEGAVPPSADDWILVPGLFSEAERPGLVLRLAGGGCRCAAIFHDAIPIKRPDISWAHSVARHPGYMKLLAQFDHVFCVSRASEAELHGYWRWLGVLAKARTSVLQLGADFASIGRVTEPSGDSGVRFLCVGILEPRKNQDFLLDVCEGLWASGLHFGIDFVGRVNPEFGRPIARRVGKAKASGRDVRHLKGLGDKELERLYRNSRAVLFPSVAEGCGLPLLEALWLGTTCIHSDLPPLLENAEGGGTCAVALNDFSAWTHVLRRAVSDDRWIGELRAQARARELPTWDQAAGQVRRTLGARL
ncbi:MAG: glycosyltransferase [Opitutaceae bacterium]|nr:glycosyltransferase [Opitutaceae bacterium]